ncbi:MAG: class I tRNA ligase family protein, partial [Vallitaleaceae bacterium]|nr:class I tRNA ligase family protein [Vallitaleaceae bacterium]
NSYYTHTDENITGIWHFLQICHQNNWITQAHKPMPWCPRCGTSLSEHEMTGSYKEIEHTAVFARLKLIEKDWDILVWTTTPWTLSANVALAVNPEIDYSLVDCGDGKRPIITATNTLKILNGKKEILETFKGSELIGTHYETFFPLLPIQKDIVHTIIPWNEVSASEGCGVVHIAPGCGAQDFELGKLHNLPEICPVDEDGIFYDHYDFLSGLEASKTADLIFEQLTSQDKLYKTHPYTHSYPVCWRCKTDVLFRLVNEWYIKTDEIKPKLIQEAQKVQWEPAYIGKRMNDWLENMGDWNISRKRFYGLPLPFYPCSCGQLTVVGSKEELIQLSGASADQIPELHRPWIDEIKISCPKCGHQVERITAVGDVWLDAGIVPFSTQGYFTNRSEWENNFPAEWVTEMREQVRLWFYSQLFMSVTLTGKAPYERVLAYSSVVSEDGTKFSKTGFMIPFDTAAEKMGADTIRYLFAGANTSSDVRFGLNLGDEARRKLLSFYNIYTFFMTYAVLDLPDLSGNDHPSSTNITDFWLDCRINSFLVAAEASYLSYNTPELIHQFELCMDDVSNWYIRINRRRFWKQGLDENKISAYKCLYNTIKIMTQVMAPIIPFLSEYIWQSMVCKFDSGAEMSVHLSRYPQAKALIGDEIMEETELVRELITAALKLRNEKQIKVKQPLSKMYVKGLQLKRAASSMLEIIKDELNVREIVFLDEFVELFDSHLELNFKTAGTALKENLRFVKESLASLTEEEMKTCVVAYKNKQSIQLSGISQQLLPDFFTLGKKSKGDKIVFEGDHFSIALDIILNDELLNEGLYRELLRHCQVLRKEAGFHVEEHIHLGVFSESKAITDVLIRYKEEIKNQTLADSLEESLTNSVFTKTVSLGGSRVELQIGTVNMANN